MNTEDWACRGRAPAWDGQRADEPEPEWRRRAAKAVAVCRACPALDACRAYRDDLHAQHLHIEGVMAAQLPDGRRGKRDMDRDITRLVHDGHTSPEIGRLLGVSEWTVQRARRRLGLAVSRYSHDSELVDEIRRLAAAGVPDVEIGYRLGRSRDSIQHYRNRYGIPCGTRRLA